MSTASHAVPGHPPVAPAPTGLPRRARPFFALVVSAAAVGGAAVLPRLDTAAPGWLAFFVLLLGAAAAHTFAVHTPRNQVFHMGLAFTVAGTLLLPPELVVLLCVAQHL